MIKTMTMNSPMSPMVSSPAAGVNLQSRFSAALRRPFSQQKCFELSQLIQEGINSRSKEIQLCFAPLLENIFGINQTAYDYGDWGLKNVYRNFNPNEFELLYAFLCPEGILFELIRHLMRDSSFACDLPMSYLPTPTRKMFEDGQTPTYYVNKIDVVHPNNVCLNALEFYLFLFFYYTQTPARLFNVRQAADPNPSNLAHVAIMESYLRYFLPLSSERSSDKNGSNHDASLHNIWNTLSSTTSNLLHGNLTNFQTSEANNAATPKSSLLNIKLLNAGSASHPSNSHLSPQGVDVLGSQTWKGECFLNIFTEMLLNVNVPPHLVSKKRQSPSAVESNFLPSVEHVRAVRIFVKHVHFFANSAMYTDHSVNPQLHVTSTTLNELKQNIWTPRYSVQGKLYGFLKLCFEGWPSDASLRMPLETWLSYIQPWRYTNLKDASLTNSDEDVPLDSVIDSRWKPFVANDLLFYSVIFRQVLERLHRLDLASSKNALMLHRTVKVFSQNNLKHLIVDAEQTTLNSIHSRTPLFASPRGRGSSPLSHAPGISSQLLEFEDQNFVYVSLFSDECKGTVGKILQYITAVKLDLEELMKESTPEPTTDRKEKSFFQSLKSLMTSEVEPSVDEQVNLAEFRKSDSFIQQSLIRLRQLFDLGDETMDETFLSDTMDSSVRQRHTSPSASKIKKAEMTPPNLSNPRKLTERGRRQVLTRQGKAEVGYEGNPDMQPRRTYEIALLLPLLLWISEAINEKYAHIIQNHFPENSLLGSVVRAVAMPPVSYIRVIKHGPTRPPERVLEHLPPRIQLRFLANQFLLVTGILLFSFCYLVGYRPISLLFTGSIFLLTYIGSHVLAERVQSLTSSM